jgi:hypothetical protein
MEINKRTVMITASFLLIAAGISSIAVGRVIRRREVDEIYRVLNKGIGFYGGIDDLSATAFNPDYLSKLPKDIEVIILSDAKVTEVRQNLAKSLDVIIYNSADHERVMSIFRGLRDFVQISQIARSFQRHTGKSLIGTLKTKMGDRINDLNQEIKNYPKYRIKN